MDKQIRKKIFKIIKHYFYFILFQIPNSYQRRHVAQYFGDVVFCRKWSSWTLTWFVTKLMAFKIRLTDLEQFPSIRFLKPY